MKKVLITGGAGYIGSILTSRLLDLGYHVTVYDNFLFGASGLLTLSINPGLTIIKGDIRDRKNLYDVIKNQDLVIHLAAIVGYPACAADPTIAKTTNIEGTKNVVDCMSRNQRLIFASTGSTYGKTDGIVSEETAIAPLTLYGLTKKEGEFIVEQSNLEYIIFRFATVFGTSPRLRLDLLINDFVYQAIHNKQIILFEGNFRRTFLHCRDAAEIYPFAIQNFEKMKGQKYNIGEESMNCTKREIALKIQKHINYYLHEAETGTDLDQRDYEVDYSKLKALGFKAKYDIETGIQELIKILSVISISNPFKNI